MVKSKIADALVESIVIEDPTLIEDGARASVVTGAAVNDWLDEADDGPAITHPLLAFQARRGDIDERVALHVATETGRLAIAIARPGGGKWRRHTDITLMSRDMYPLTRTLGLAVGDKAALAVAAGQRIGRAVAAAL